MIRVPRPRLETVRRHSTGQMSQGDFAVATATTGLIDFLDRISLGDCQGYELRYSIPFQLGATAAEAILAPTRSEPGVHWAAFQAEVNWVNLCGPRQNLEAAATLERYTNTLASFTLETRSGGSAVTSGRIHYARVRDTGKPAPETEAAHCEHSPERGRYSPFLLELLMNPIPPSTEPLGRRMHPLGSVPLAAAVFQAKRIAPGLHPIAATMDYVHPFGTKSGFIAEPDLLPDGRIAVTFRSASGRLLARSCVLPRDR